MVFMGRQVVYGTRPGKWSPHDWPACGGALAQRLICQGVLYSWAAPIANGRQADCCARVLEKCRRIGRRSSSKQAGRRRHNRRCHDRQGRAGRLHDPAALFVAELHVREAGPSLRTFGASGSHPVRVRPAKGSWRGDCSSQGKTRRNELCVGWRRFRLAHGSRTIYPNCGHKGSAHSVPRAGRGVLRSHGGTHRLLFSADRTGASGDPERQGAGARREHAEAGTLTTKRADRCRSRLSRRAVSVLGWSVGAGENAARHRRQTARRIQKALNLPVVQARLEKLGVQPMPMSADEFGKFFREDVAATVKLAKDIGIVPTN